MNKKLIFIVCASIFSVGVIVANASNDKITKTVTLIENQPISIQYKTRINKNNMVSDIYADNQDNQYIYVDENLVGFIKDRNLKENNQISRQSMTVNQANILISQNRLNVTNFARNIIDTNHTSLNDYQLTKTNFVESYDELNYVFTKEIDGYKVNDSITISTDLNGEIVSFVANRQGDFDNYKNMTIDDEDVLDFIESEITTNYDNVDYVIENQIIDFVDNKLVLANYIKLEYPDYISSTILYYDL